MKNQTEQIWDEVWQNAPAGNLLTALRFAYNRLLGNLFLPHLTKASRSLELGCGTAQLTLMVAPQISEAVGLDISSEGLAIAEREKKRLNILNATFVKVNVQNVPYNNEFDVVWSAGLIEHFFNHDIDIVQQHIKATKPGGIVVMSVPYAYSLHSLHYVLTRPALLRRFWPWSQERYFQKFYSRRALRNLGNRLGLPYKVYFLRPWFVGWLLGIIVIEIKKIDKIVKFI